MIAEFAVMATEVEAVVAKAATLAGAAEGSSLAHEIDRTKERIAAVARGEYQRNAALADAQFRRA